MASVGGVSHYPPARSPRQCAPPPPLCQKAVSAAWCALDRAVDELAAVIEEGVKREKEFRDPAFRPAPAMPDPENQSGFHPLRFPEEPDRQSSGQDRSALVHRYQAA